MSKKVFDAMRKRKEYLRQASEEQGAVKEEHEEQAQRLYEQALKEGGLTSDEAQALALL